MSRPVSRTLATLNRIVATKGRRPLGRRPGLRLSSPSGSPITLNSGVCFELPVMSRSRHAALSVSPDLTTRSTADPAHVRPPRALDGRRSVVGSPDLDCQAAEDLRSTLSFGTMSTGASAIER